MDKIAKRIKELREDHDDSQEKLACKIQVTRKQIARWEKGEQEMGISKLKEYCKIYDVSADYILGLPKGLHWPR